MHLSGRTSFGPAPDIYLIANADRDGHDFELPRLDRSRWYRFVDTSLDWDDAIMEPEKLKALDDPDVCHVAGNSVIVLIAGGSVN